MSLKWPEQIPASGRVTKDRLPAQGNTTLVGTRAVLIRKPDDMLLNSVLQRMRRGVVTSLLSAIALSVAACASLPSPSATHIVVPKRVELMSGGSKSLNYTPWYIHTWELTGPTGMGIGGGGPNVMPVRDDGSPSGGAKETCCTSIPRDWLPDLSLTVRWLVDKKRDGKTPGYW